MHKLLRRIGMVGATALIPMMIASPGSAELAESMKRQLDEMFLWKNRVIVITAPSDGDPRLLAQKGLLDDCAEGLIDRDVVVVEYFEPSRNGQPTKKVMEKQEQLAFRVYLVGKDGGIKLTSKMPVPPQEIFALIDQMPMRRSELQARGGLVACSAVLNS